MAAISLPRSVKGSDRPSPLRILRRRRAVPAAGGARSDVVAIKQTLYRTSNNSPIVRTLAEAAEAGKIRDRADRAQGADSTRKPTSARRATSNARMQVVYGFIELEDPRKTVDGGAPRGRQPHDLCPHRHRQLHPVTARIYTDLSDFTSDRSSDAMPPAVFNYIAGYAEPSDIERMAVSPLTLEAHHRAYQGRNQPRATANRVRSG